MRDDLLDAQAALEWSLSQITPLQETLFGWCKEHPFDVTEEPDPEFQGFAVVARPTEPFPLIYSAWAGAVINSLRSSLDLLAAALAVRNNKPVTREIQFPIFQSEQHMLDPKDGIDRKLWLSAADISLIKSLKPYKGGDENIWPLHDLDIERKHHRLLQAGMNVHNFHWERGRPGSPHGYEVISSFGVVERLKDKVVLFRRGGWAAEPIGDAPVHQHVASYVIFNESALGVADQEVAPTLSRFAKRVGEILAAFP